MRVWECPEPAQSAQPHLRSEALASCWHLLACCSASLYRPRCRYAAEQLLWQMYSSGCVRLDWRALANSAP